MSSLVFSLKWPSIYYLNSHSLPFFQDMLNCIKPVPKEAETGSVFPVWGYCLIGAGSAALLAGLAAFWCYRRYSNT